VVYTKDFMGMINGLNQIGVIKGLEVTESDGIFHTIIQNGLIAYYRFEDDGNVLHDYSGNNYHGTLKNSPTWETGKIGNCLEFDGVNQYVETSSDPINASSANSEFSISFWIYPTAAADGNLRHVIDDGIWTNGSYVFYISSGMSRIVFGIQNDSGTRNETANAVISVDTWQHVVGVWDGTNTKIYIDNSLSSNSGSIGGSVSGQSWLRIAQATTDFEGKIDEIRIYDRALSSDEIELIYNEENTLDKMSVDVSSGRALFEDVYIEAGDETLELNDSDASNDRKDLIYLTPSGSLSISTGTAASTPIPPNIGGNKRMILGEITVSAGASTITNSDIRDERHMIYGNKYQDVFEGGNPDDGICSVNDDEASLDSEDWSREYNPMKRWGGY